MEMEKASSIKEIFGLHNTCSTFGATPSEMNTLLSKLLQSSGIAFLTISYPEVDERNHRSLDTLTHKLIAHGFSDAADLVKANSPYILFEDLNECMKVLHEFQQDSFAISARLYFKGLDGAAAEHALNAILHPVETKPELAHAA
jgi:hypothetical protein